MGRADLTNEQWVRLVPLLPTGKKLHASFAKLSLGPCRGGCPCCWHGGWHRIAIAAIVDQGQVLADVGQEHSLTCGFAVNVNIRGGVRIFKTGDILYRRFVCCGRV
jgi:hypothetical protein